VFFFGGGVDLVICNKNVITGPLGENNRLPSGDVCRTTIFKYT